MGIRVHEVFIEPAITSHNYRKVELGFDYHRNNVSGSFINAFIKAKYKDFVIYFEKFPFSGASHTQTYYSIRMFPAYENILIKFSKYNFSFDLMLGQIDPITNEKI